MDQALQARLADWLGGVLGAAVGIDTVERLPAERALRPGWLVGTTVGGAPSQFMLRFDAPPEAGHRHGRADEVAILELARSHGVAAPKLIAHCDDEAVLGARFALFEAARGVCFGLQVVGDLSLGGDRRALTDRLGRELARIHRIVPPHPRLSALAAPDPSASAAAIADLRRRLDRLRLGRPAIEWGLRWAELDAPTPGTTSLVHGDFRTGNYLVDQAGLVAIGNWQSARWGDPWSDLGCFCAECWRFGRTDLEAGGIGTREEFYQAYEDESGVGIDDEAVRHWEVLALVRQAVSVLELAARIRGGAVPTLETVLAGRSAGELELAIVHATAPSAWRRNNDR